MKKMRKFAWIFMAAMTVAGFSACSNVDDPELPTDGSEGTPGGGSADGEGIFSWEFSTSFGEFTTQSVSGDESWEIDYGTAKMTGYINDSKENHANEDWLISPAITLGNITSAKLSMTYIARYFSNLATDVTLQVSENYTGGAPSTAQWTEVAPATALVSGSDWETFATTEYSLTPYVGKTIRFAIKYLSTDTKAGTLEVKSVKVEEGEAVGGGGNGDSGASSEFSWEFATSFGEFTTQDVLGDESWEIDYGTAKMTGYINDSKENHANEDWLISPAITLGNVPAAKLSMTYIARYFSNLATDVTLQVSENYTGGAPSTAQWTEVAPATALVSGSDWETFATTEYSLTPYVGKTIRFAIKYLSTDTKAGTLEVKSVKVEEGEATVDTPDTPDTPEVDWSQALTVAEGMTYDDADATIISVKGYIVGCLKKGGKTSYTSVDDAAGDVEIGLESYTGYNTVFIADDPAELDYTKCLCVKLNDNTSNFPGAKGLKDAAKLETHPERVGEVLYVKGAKKTMFSALPGIRDIQDWKVGE